MDRIRELNRHSREIFRQSTMADGPAVVLTELATGEPGGTVIDGDSPPKIRFAPDSPVERKGFELLVPPAGVS
jgi:hypothetical protein